MDEDDDANGFDIFKIFIETKTVENVDGGDYFDEDDDDSGQVIGEDDNGVV